MKMKNEFNIKKEIVCPKCKKPLEDASFLMMGIDKKCFDCHVTWTKMCGFKSFFTKKWLMK